jgi:hypothetical protein
VASPIGRSVNPIPRLDQMNSEQRNDCSSRLETPRSGVSPPRVSARNGITIRVVARKSRITVDAVYPPPAVVSSRWCSWQAVLPRGAGHSVPRWTAQCHLGDEEFDLGIEPVERILRPASSGLGCAMRDLDGRAKGEAIICPWKPVGGNQNRAARTESKRAIGEMRT